MIKKETTSLMSAPFRYIDLAQYLYAVGQGRYNFQRKIIVVQQHAVLAETDA